MKYVNIPGVVKVSIVMALCMNSAAHATHLLGSVHLADQTYADLEINGTAHLTNVAITNSALLCGSIYCFDVSCTELVVKGSLHSESAQIQHANVVGACHCNNSNIAILSVDGSCIMHNTNIVTQLSVHGSLIASKCTCPLVEVCASHSEFKKSSIDILMVKEIEKATVTSSVFNLWGLLNWGASSEKPREIYLDESSVANILFEGEPGLVILTHGATVTKVVNGTIEKRS